MKKVGIIGWRGMVGSTLVERMRSEGDFDKFSSYFYSTSMGNQSAPKITNCHEVIFDSYNLDQLMEMDTIVTCQGSEYTELMHPKLRKSGWTGFWIDAASSLRQSEGSIICLDPINKIQIEAGLNSGVKDFIGGNCTVSLMLMSLGGLFKEGLVDWVSSMTYQAASGAGAGAMIELLDQMKHITNSYDENISKSALEIEKILNLELQESNIPQKNFSTPLGLSLIPWIDSEVKTGQTKEEWKAQAEANKILGLSSNEIIPIDGTCVRVSSLRCHSQAFTIKLNKDLPIKDIESIIEQSSPWTEIVSNDKQSTLDKLSPVNVSGTLSIPVGRIRKLSMGPEFINAFTVGDQLLWGAAEPLRRMLLLTL